MAESPTTDPAAEADAALARWTAVLDSLERTADAAGALIHQHTRGIPGTSPRPVRAQQLQRTQPNQQAKLPPLAALPDPAAAAVRARAVALAARQEALIRQLEEARADVARQLQAVSSIPGIGAPAAAVYLDVTG
ncbi:MULTISPECIES: hypothetical protein [unclassified Pseudarthrobacter]|uniref:hypothetical protein n=1 Tax=unclassified Pseudarthrobacter TaxID=2647000 RepID=UPI001402C857|nr:MULTISPECIES: hypothetical protein [unclassified Pseudarthrobacter]